MTGTPGPGNELVGPVVMFTGGPRKPRSLFGRRTQVSVPQGPPKNTCDPRHDQCTVHHLACDCREALLAEYIHEYRAELEGLRKQIVDRIVGHRTWVRDSTSIPPFRPLGLPTSTSLQCPCGLCDLARNTYLPGAWLTNEHVLFADGTVHPYSSEGPW